jgi:hypothetical protein
MISTTDIKYRLDGIAISGAFIEDVLKVKARERVKKGMYWEEADWPRIKKALASYVNKLPDEPIDDGL